MRSDLDYRVERGMFWKLLLIYVGTPTMFYLEVLRALKKPWFVIMTHNLYRKKYLDALRYFLYPRPEFIKRTDLLKGDFFLKKYLICLPRRNRSTSLAMFEEISLQNNFRGVILWIQTEKTISPVKNRFR